MISFSHKTERPPPEKRLGGPHYGSNTKLIFIVKLNFIKFWKSVHSWIPNLHAHCVLGRDHTVVSYLWTDLTIFNRVEHSVFATVKTFHHAERHTVQQISKIMVHTRICKNKKVAK